MFKRLILEEWQMVIPVVAFALTFGVFLILSAKAILLGEKQSEHMASLPLANDDGSQKKDKPFDQN
ncbi:MAG: hypothetical protein L3J39_02230 [Verrucomicrobiales bacterium]|nr:hypothetical protein [Verrucomicrobiales bacterium]